MYKAVLFDLDGTLIDSMPNFTNFVKAVLKDCGAEYNSEIIKVLTPLGANGIVNYLKTQMNVEITTAQLLEKLHEVSLNAYRYEILAKNNVVEVLNALKVRGEKLSVLSASPHLTIDPCLKRLKVFDLFSNVWSCEDFSTGKQDPNLYQMVAEKLGARTEEILFFDDNFNAISTAKAVGMKTCGVYDESSKDFVDKMKEQNDYYIYDFKEIIEKNI